MTKNTCNDVVVLSNAVKKPVKVMWTREDDVHNGRFNPLSAHYLRAGFDASGKLVAYHHRKATDEVTASPRIPVRFGRANGRDVIAFVGIDAAYYEIPNRLAEAVPQDSGLRTSSLRGISHLTNIFAIESFMDELARKRGVDPAAFRRELVKTSPRALHIIDRVARMADWGRKRDGSALGFTYMNYSGTQIALVAEVSLDRRTGHRCGCRGCGRRSIPASRCNPTISWPRPRAASSTGSGSPFTSASRSTTARSRSRISTTTMCRA